MAEDKATKTDVEQFVQNNLVPTKNGRRCVDGRYPKGSVNSGTLARPGGDFGYVMALLAVNRSRELGLTPEQCVEKVFSVVTGNGSEFSMHSDHHSPFPNEEGANLQIGCGHIAKAMDPATNSGYGMSNKDVQKALNYIQSMVKNGQSIHLDNLNGDHEEMGVLVVTGTKRSVDPSDGQFMYFVYDQTRDVGFMKDLITNLAIPGLATEEFIEAADKQLETTLKNLALGLPQFSLNADRDLAVQAAGIVG